MPEITGCLAPLPGSSRAAARRDPRRPGRRQCRLTAGVLWFLLLLLLPALTWSEEQEAAGAGEGAAPAAGPARSSLPRDSPRPFTAMPTSAFLAVLVAATALGLARALLPRSWRGPADWLRACFEHTVRIGWIAFLPAVIVDGLVFFLGGTYSHGWAILAFALAASPFAAGLQWEKPRWNARRRREEPYVGAFSYYGGLALAALIPALIADGILAAFAAAGRLAWVTTPLNLLALAALVTSGAFLGGRLAKVLIRGVLLPHTAVRFLLSPASRYYAMILTLSLIGMAAFNYLTLPAFFETASFTAQPFPAITVDQALIILVPNALNILCVTYFSIFAGTFISILPIILFSRSLRKKPPVPPALDVLIRDAEVSRQYLGKELRAEDLWPTVVTITAYNEPPDPLEKTLHGYLKVAREWVRRGLPRDRYVIVLSHQTEREEDRLDFERFLAERFPQVDPSRLIDRDWARFDEDNPGLSIRDESKLNEVLLAWLEAKGLDPESKEGRSEMEKRRVCQRLFEFSLYAPRELFGLDPPPAREYGPQRVTSWVWYYLIPKKVGGRLLQVSSKAHNLYYAREAIWGKAATSPLARDGIFRDAEEWLFDASDADSEIHESCVPGIIASYSPFYKEPRLGWLQRLSYTIEPGATFLSAVKSASETAYWSWFLRARVHTYQRRGKDLVARVGDVQRPVRRDFQAANGHNLVVRGTSIRMAGGDIEHQVATLYEIDNPIRRWMARLGRRRVAAEQVVVEKWVPTGEDLELATRMSLEGYYGDYAVYAPQGEGSPADFRGNVPQAIRWSGNNVQLTFMHLAKVFSTDRLTFNEKIGYFVNLATLASAPLLYLTVLRSVAMPFLEIPDVYAAVHPGLGPMAFVLALAPNFLLLSLALAGQLVTRPVEPWQRSVLGPGHRRLLQWCGAILIPPLSVLVATFIPGWCAAVGIHLPDGLAWGLVIAAINLNIALLLAKPEVYASLAYCIVLLPFLQVLYLAWIVFGVIGCINMLVKTQIVEPYLSRLAGTFYPPVAGRYPSDAGGRFLAMTQRYPRLFAPVRWARDNHRRMAVALGAVVGLVLWLHPPPGWPREAALAVGFLVTWLWAWRSLPGLLNDWFLDRDSLINRWWDYWTNPQAAFVKTLKERQERSPGTILKDNVFGIVNGLFLLAIIIHVHFVHAADFSAALLAYLTFSIAASWIISPFFYEEPHRSLRSQGKATIIAVILTAAFLAIPLGLLAKVEAFLGFPVLPPVLVPWVQGFLAVLALGGLVNLAPWGGLRAFAKRVALAAIMLGLLFLNALAISYRGVAIEPLVATRALEAEGAFVRETRDREIARGALGDLEANLSRAEEEEVLGGIKERLAFRELEEVRAADLPRAAAALEHARRNRLLAAEVEAARLEIEKGRTRIEDAVGGTSGLLLEAGSRELVLDALASRAREEVERRREHYRQALETREGYQRRLAAATADQALAGLAVAYETEVVAPLREGLARAQDLAARIDAAGAGVEDLTGLLAEVESASGGEVHAARRAREKADQEWEQALDFDRALRGRVHEAEEGYERAMKERLAAARRRETLEARCAAAARRSERLERLRREGMDLARKAFWTTPERYADLRKDLARFRPLLEEEEARARIGAALRWVASRSRLKQITLEGAPWYPKTTVLHLLEQELPGRVRQFAEAAADAGVARREAGLLAASASLAAVAKLIASPGEPGRAARANALEESAASLQAAVAEDAEETAVDKASGEALAASRAALAELEDGSRPGDVPAPGGDAERLAQAGLETAANLLAEHARRGPPGLAAFTAWLEGGGSEGLDPRSRDVLVSRLARTRKEDLESSLEDLRGLHRAALSAGKPEGVVHLLTVSSTLSSASWSGEAPASGLQPPAGLPRLVRTLTRAFAGGEKALRAEQALVELEDRILLEIDRLEPYLTARLDGRREAAPEYPLFLLHLETERRTGELQGAWSDLRRVLERESGQLERQLALQLRPERDQARGDLLQALEATRTWALETSPAFSWEWILRRMLAGKLARVAADLAALFDPSGSGQGGLIAETERREAEAGAASLAAARAAGDPGLELRARRGASEARLARARSEEAWVRVRKDLDEAQRLEEMVRGAARRRAGGRRVEVLEDLARATTRSIEEGLSRREVLEEELRAADRELAALARDGASEGDLRLLLADARLEIPRLAGGVPALEEKARRLRGELLRLETEPPPAPSAGPSPPEETPSGVPAVPVPPAAPTVWTAGTAIEAAIAAASRPGGPVFLAAKESEIAREEIRRSAERFYPELFGTLGGATNAPSGFLGGGFTLVTLSLDMFENQNLFERREEEKEYVRELAELLAALQAVRALGAVAAAELELAGSRAEVGRILREIEPLARAHGSTPGEDLPLLLERERLETAVVFSAEKLAAARRALGSLAGRPPLEPVSAGFEETGDEAAAAARLDAWLGEAREAIRARFPRHPAFQKTLAVLARIAAAEDEARMKVGWPVLRAGAGAAAPNEVPFSVGASLLFPILDRQAGLTEAESASERRLEAIAGDERLAAERLRREGARARQRRATSVMAGRREVLAARASAVREAVNERLHGFAEGTAQIASEVRSFRLAVEESGALAEYLASGLDLVEADAALAAAPEPGDRPAVAAGGEAAAGAGPTEPPPVARAREQAAAAAVKAMEEDRLFKRFGVGAGFSYSSLFLPLPSVELAYGTSARRREMAGAEMECRRKRVELAADEHAAVALAARLDALRDANLAAAVARRVRLAEGRLELASRLEREGREPPLAVAAARSRLAEARRDLEAALARAEESAARERGLAAFAVGPLAGGEGAKVLLDRQAIDGAISAAAPGFERRRPAAVREALVSEVEYRYRALAAAIENKKPYGGNIGNFVAPIWDLVRLWRRPGSPEEIEAALGSLRAALLRLESAPESSEEADKEFDAALAAAKSALAGDAYDAEEVGKALHAWREAELALETHDRLAAAERMLADGEYRASLAALDWIEARGRRLAEEARVLPVSGAVGRADPLRALELEEEILRAEESRAGALWRYAKARAAQVHAGGPLDPSPGDRPPPAAVSVPELARAYVERDPQVLSLRALLAARQRELALTRRLSPVNASIPVVLPSLAVDPRFAGSGLAASMSTGVDVERFRHAAVVEHEAAALAAGLEAAAIEARFAAVLAGIDLEHRRLRIAAQEEEIAGRRTHLSRIEAERESGDVSRALAAQARARLEEAERTLAVEQEGLRRAEEEVTARAGVPVTVQAPAAGEAGTALQAAGEGGATRARALAAEERARGARESASWRRRDAILGSRVEVIGSLGQSPEELDAGAGGFLAIPVHRLLGIGGRTARIDELRAEASEGEKSAIERAQDEEAAGLRAELAESAVVLARRSRELEIARQAYAAAEEEGLSFVLGAEAGAAAVLESTRDYLGARARQEVLEVRLAPHSPLPPREAPPAPGRTGEQPDAGVNAPAREEADLALEIVEELTSLPGGQQREAEELEARRELLSRRKGELPGLAARELRLELGPRAAFDAAWPVLEREDADPALRQVWAPLRLRLEEREAKLLAVLGARTIGERIDLLETGGGGNGAAGGDLDSEIEAGLERIAPAAGVEEAWRRALERALEDERASLARRLDLLRDRSSAEPEPSLRAGDLDLAGLAARAGLAEAAAARAREGLEELERLVPEVRRAKRLDAVARWDATHAARGRKLVQAIDLHGLHARAVAALDSVLRLVREAAPAEYRRFVVRFKERQIELAEGRLEASPPALDGERSRIETLLRDLLLADDAERLDRVKALRGEIARQLVIEAGSRRSARRAGEAIASRLEASRSIAAGRQAIRLEESLAREIEALFAGDGMRRALPAALERLKEERLAALEARRRSLARELEKTNGEKPRPLLVETGLKALTRAAGGKLEGDLGAVAAAVHKDARALRLEAIRWRISRDQWLESSLDDLALPRADERAARAREAVEHRRRLAGRRTALEESWRRLIAEANAAADNRRPTLVDRWRAELARAATAAGQDREEASWFIATLLPPAVEAVAGFGAQGKEAGAILERHLRARLRVETDLSRLLADAGRARRLEDLAWEAEAFVLGPGAGRTVADLKRLADKGGLDEAAGLLAMEPASLKEMLAGPLERPFPAPVPTLSLEKVIREAAATRAAVRGKVQALLGAFALEHPAGFLRWVKEAGLRPVSLARRLAALEEAEKRRTAAAAGAKQVSLALGEAVAEERLAAAWRRAEEASQGLRREVLHGRGGASGILSPLAESGLLESGYLDKRGRLSNLPDLVRRDGHRLRTAFESLLAMGSEGPLRKPPAVRDVEEFLDLQIATRIARPEEAGEPLAAGSPEPGELGHSRSAGGRDESFTRDQALHALACLALHQGGWDERGIEKAALLLRPYALHLARARTAGSRFRGFPALFLAASGEAAGVEGDPSADALVAIAAQHHAALSGSSEFLPLADGTAALLLPLVAGGTGGGAEALHAGALAVAVFANQAGIEHARGNAGSAARYEQAGEAGARWLLEECWSEEQAAFVPPGGWDDLDGNLIALAVLARHPGLGEARIEKAARALAARFRVEGHVTEDLDSLRAFRPNWFLNGPIHAYNRFLVPLSRQLGSPREEVTGKDAWLFLNRALHRASRGSLGFTTEVEGLAPDSRRLRLDHARTAQAIWVLHFLGRRIEETTREGSAEFMEAEAADLSRNLAAAAVADDRDPLAKSWPIHLTAGEAAGGSRLRWCAGENSTEAACHWVFGRVAKQGVHPFLVAGFKKLASLAGATSAAAASSALAASAEDAGNPAAAIDALLRGLDGLRTRLETQAAEEPAGGEITQAVDAPRGAGAGAGRIDPALRRGLAWLAGRIDPRTGLPRALEDPAHPFACRPYPAALAIIHLSLAGAQGGDARRLAQALDTWRAMVRVRRSDGAWADQYDSRTGAVDPSPASWATGPNSWMVLAGLHLHLASGDARVLREARETLDWVLSFQDLKEGAPTFGAVTLGEMLHPQAISTEANADALAAAWGCALLEPGSGPAGQAAARPYAEAARRIAEFLATRMWLPEPGCFATGWRLTEPGPRIEEEWLDSQTWTYLALDATRAAHGRDPRRLNGLLVLADRVTEVRYRGAVLHGFAKLTLGIDAFWPEGVAGYILAARAAGMPERFTADLEAARFADDSLPHMIGSMPSRDWRVDLRYPAIDGTVWAAWADAGVNFNPFRIDTQARPQPAAAAGTETAGAAPRREEAAGEKAEEEKARQPSAPELERRRRISDRLREIEALLRKLQEEMGR